MESLCLHGTVLKGTDGGLLSDSNRWIIFCERFLRDSRWEFFLGLCLESLHRIFEGQKASRGLSFAILLMNFLKLLLVLIGKYGEFAAPSHDVIYPWCPSCCKKTKRVLFDHVVIYFFDWGLEVGTQSIGVVCAVLRVAHGRYAVQMRNG